MRETARTQEIIEKIAAAVESHLRQFDVIAPKAHSVEIMSAVMPIVTSALAEQGAEIALLREGLAHHREGEPRWHLGYRGEGDRTVPVVEGTIAKADYDTLRRLSTRPRHDPAPGSRW